GKFLTYGDNGVGSTMLLEFVPTRIAGASLTTFAAGLVSNYFSIASMTRDDGIPPSNDGIPVAKDRWPAASGRAMMVDGGSKKGPSHRYRRTRRAGQYRRAGSACGR